MFRKLSARLAALLMALLCFSPDPAPAAQAESFQLYLPATAVWRDLPPGVALLGQAATFIDIGSRLHVVGEFSNNSASPIAYVQIRATLFALSHQLAATHFAYAELNTVGPRDYSCFDIIFNAPPPWTSLELEAPAYVAPSGAPSTGLTLLSPSGSTDLGGNYHILGQVRNDGAAAATFVQLVGTLYDASGQVVDCNYGFVSGLNLLPGQTSAFDVAFLSRPPYTTVARWHLNLIGHP